MHAHNAAYLSIHGTFSRPRPRRIGWSPPGLRPPRDLRRTRARCRRSGGRVRAALAERLSKHYSAHLRSPFTTAIGPIKSVHAVSRVQRVFAVSVTTTAVALKLCSFVACSSRTREDDTNRHGVDVHTRRHGRRTSPSGLQTRWIRRHDSGGGERL